MKMPNSSFSLTCRYFPIEIVSITLGYVGDHFIMNKCIFEWNINSLSLKDMCDADVGYE